MICPVCGTKNNEEAINCQECGHNIENTYKELNSQKYDVIKENREKISHLKREKGEESNTSLCDLMMLISILPVSLISGIFLTLAIFVIIFIVLSLDYISGLLSFVILLLGGFVIFTAIAKINVGIIYKVGQKFNNNKTNRINAFSVIATIISFIIPYFVLGLNEIGTIVLVIIAAIITYLESEKKYINLLFA